MKLSRYQAHQKEQLIELFKDTFSQSEGAEEGALIANLVTAFLALLASEDLKIYVATQDNELIGGIFFSRLFFPNNESVFILAPAAVSTQHQGKGVGQELINFGLNDLRDQGIEIAITYGDIHFYSKVGFAPISETLIQAPLTLSYPDGWIAQSLTDKKLSPISGKPTCLAPLANEKYW